MPSKPVIQTRDPSKRIEKNKTDKAAADQAAAQQAIAAAAAAAASKASKQVASKVKRGNGSIASGGPAKKAKSSDDGDASFFSITNRKPPPAPRAPLASLVGHPNITVRQNKARTTTGATTAGALVGEPTVGGGLIPEPVAGGGLVEEPAAPLEVGVGNAQAAANAGLDVGGVAGAMDTSVRSGGLRQGASAGGGFCCWTAIETDSEGDRRIITSINAVISESVWKAKGSKRSHVLQRRYPLGSTKDLTDLVLESLVVINLLHHIDSMGWNGATIVYVPFTVGIFEAFTGIVEEEEGAFSACLDEIQNLLEDFNINNFTFSSGGSKFF